MLSLCGRKMHFVTRRIQTSLFATILDDKCLILTNETEKQRRLGGPRSVIWTISLWRQDKIKGRSYVCAPLSACLTPSFILLDFLYTSVCNNEDHIHIIWVFFIHGLISLGIMLYYPEGSQGIETEQEPNSPAKIFSGFPVKLSDNTVLLLGLMIIIF